MRDIDLLENAARRMYGEQWQTPLAKALGINDRTVRRWAAGNNKVPKKIWPLVYAILIEQERAIREASDLVRKVKIEKVTEG